jgi:cell division transport system permease protein
MVFVVTEGWRRLRRERARTWAVAGIIGAVLLQVALVLLAARGLDRAFRAVQGRFEMTVYLSPSALPADRDRVRRILETDPSVASVNVVTKEEAIEEYRRDPDVARMVRILGENPLSDSMTASLKPGSDESLEGVEGRLKADSSVEEVDSGSGEWRAVSRLGHSARLLGALWCLLMLLTALWTVSSTLVLVSHAHREEFLLLQRLGAPPWALIGPFLWEGVLQGVLGALSAVLGVGLLALVFTAAAGPDGLLQSVLSPPPSDWFRLGLVLAVLGALLGAIGAWNAGRHVTRRVNE